MYVLFRVSLWKDKKLEIMSYDKYQSQAWVTIQQEVEEDENSGSIMDQFKK